MATIIARTGELPFEVPGPSLLDEMDPMGVRLGANVHIPLLKRFGMATQIGTIWLGTWGILSVLTFVLGNFVLLWAGLTSVNGNFLMWLKYFANIQELPPPGLGFARDLVHGGYWELNLALWVASVAFWALRCLDRLRRYQMRPFLFFAFLSAISLTTIQWVIRPIMMGTWEEAPGLGLNVDLDWAQNYSVLWGNLYYNPWHMLAIFFLFGSVMLWGMHGATILATANEGSHMEDAEIKDMHSGSHKSMLFWRWTMGFNANPKTIHDWLLWFAVGTVVASGIGLLVTGTVVNDWYVWGVDHGWVQQYGPMTRDAVNQRPRPFSGVVTGDNPDVVSLQLALAERRHVTIQSLTVARGAVPLAPSSGKTLAGLAQILRSDPAMKLQIEGDVDTAGSSQANLKVSQTAADAAKNALVTTYHIAPGRLTTAGLGDTQPVLQSDSPGAQAVNNRIDAVRVGE